MKVKTLVKMLDELDPDESVKIDGDCLVTDNFCFRLPTKKKKPNKKTKPFIPTFQDSTGDGDGYVCEEDAV